MAAIQLKLFEETSELDMLRAELAEVKARSENVRRGLFARHNELSKLYIELKEELDGLKKHQIHERVVLSVT
jgi:hypothetical protein